MPEGRREWQLRLARGLCERGLQREDVEQFFRFLKKTKLAVELDEQCWRDVQASG